MSQTLANLEMNNKQMLEDDDLVILPDVDNSELIARYHLSLVGRIFNKERRNVEALIALLPRHIIWDVEGRVRGVDLGNHIFQFDFDSEADLLWDPHVGDSFPNTMTFWVCVTGIPTHFWMDPIFYTFGKRLGLVGKIDARTAKFQVEIDGDQPLKFSLRAQIPSGEIVPVSFEYVNLFRWCHNCHLNSHEVENCQKKENRDWLKKPLESKVVSLGRNGFIRKEGMRYGEISKRFTNDEKTANLQDNNSGERPQRDNKDSVWKCNDFRYAPRDDYRRNPVKHPVILKNYRNLMKPTIRGDMKSLLLQANTERRKEK
ncbi:hypothetical protein Bca52824_087608 [Brassica carinata]|uniref:Zinc knuckle CX2CX4HX4C domain-containing protein n=1 Tax=Brassica carinata TaxID=52824 RepID=A0A8X7TMY2_BRACI|nr:hypothetical protein Bca52824_087608 [Brassica carinata]